ncbi:MAG TPA: hypothetical protein VLF79_03080 [Candidatus Saccharimonadales bacterium]|nr:hypothetical protein [Candidatus Saccharimonadales bacterium]
MRNNGRSGGKRWLIVLLFVGLLAITYTYWVLHKPLPSIQPIQGSSQLTVQTPPATLTWPATEQAAVGLVGDNTLVTHNQQMPVPIASTAKLITALTVLEHKPLNSSEQGPTIALGSNDVAIYNSYKAKAGSVVQVQAGEQISEYKMLQTVMLPSANNMADSLALWAFGSMAEYNKAAGQYLAEHSIKQTEVSPDDASGFAAGTVSTAHDLAIIGELAMQNPTLAQIVSQPSATDIPVVNKIKNVNMLLGTDQIIGVKTGNTDQAGGVFVSASRITVNNKLVTIVTAVLGAPTLFQAMKDSLPLIESAQANFKPVTIVKAGTVIGHFQPKWGGSLQAVASENLTLDAWNGNAVKANISINNISPNSKKGAIIGSIILTKTVSSDQISIPVKLQQNPTKPTIWWRLLHP